MPCTTILVGKNASYDGSTLVARNEDSSNGVFEPKRMRVVHPDEQPRVYTSVLSHLTVELPDNPMRYTSVPDVIPGHGIWAEAGFNELNVGMSATETLTTNERVRGADPLVDYVPAKGNEGEDGYVPAQPGGLGEEDMVTLVLPYAKSARDGVRILGELLERYGTYENNGIAFSDVDEIWWLETIGGHHWIAKRVPDDAYVTMPNQLGIDSFDLDDAEGAQVNHVCSADLRSWMAEWHLDLTLGVEGDGPAVVFNPREAFGSHSDSDHVYNTPRAWYMQRCLNPSDVWDGPDADYTPESDDIPWSRVPERKVTIIIALELIAAAMLTFMINTGDQTLLIIGIVAYGFFGKLAVEPIIIAWLSGFASGGSVATMYGVFNFFGMTSSVIAPAVTGAISDATGSKILGFYLAVAIILVGTLLFFLVDRMTKAKAAKAEQAA